MKLDTMAKEIIRILDNNYSKYKNNNDIILIKNICKLCDFEDIMDGSVKLEDVDISSPDFYNQTIKKRKNKNETINDFRKKHKFFIKIMYACLKTDVDLFNKSKKDDNIIVIKNNMQLKRSINKTINKKVNEFIDISKKLKKNHDELDKYIAYMQNYEVVLKSLRRLDEVISKVLSDHKYLHEQNLNTLILPYFYREDDDDIIEEYG